MLPVNPKMPGHWKEGSLKDGTPCKFPESYSPESQPDGSKVIKAWQSFFGVTIQMAAEGLLKAYRPF